MPSSAWPAWDAKVAQEIIDAHLHLAGATLPILHEIQGKFGCVPEAAIPLIAEALNVTRAEMHGVVTFYHDFRREPPGACVVKVCRAEACQSMGGPAAADALLKSLKIEWGETTPDQRVTVDPVYCLGLCAVAPAALIGGEPLGRLDGDKLIGAVAEAIKP